MHLLQALNNLQSTVAGFSFVSATHVFRVCDEPHPELLRTLLLQCVAGEIATAYATMHGLHRLGYAADDILANLFRVCKVTAMPEFVKLEFIKVGFFTCSS